LRCGCNNVPHKRGVEGSYGILENGLLRLSARPETAETCQRKRVREECEWNADADEHTVIDESEAMVHGTLFG
jgi:hypothetical protein